MNNNLSLKSLLTSFVFFFIFLLDIHSQSKIIQPMGLNCTVTSFSPYTLYAASNSGQVYPSVSVQTNINCTNYTVSENCSWLSYYQNGSSITIYVDANTGPERSAYVWIGTYGEPLEVIQACGNAPGTAGNISGSNIVCPNQTEVSYSVAPISGATGYQWLFPSGATIVSGNNTNSIRVNFSSSASSGYVTVQGSNDCSNGQTSTAFPITVSTINQPQAIQGSTSICAGGTYTYNIPTVPGAIGYTWSLPQGASGSSNTNTINVTYGSYGGVLSVVAHNANGCISSPSQINVNLNTLTQYTVSGGGTICPNSQTTVDLSGSSSGAWYNLYLNGVVYSSAIGNGDVIHWNGLNLPGTYTVTGEIQGCQVPMIGSATITVLENAVAPTSISGVTPICPQDNVVLSIEGGKLNSGASWKWYVNDPNSTPVSSGSAYTVSPSETTTYYVKSVGGSCLTSNPVSKVINVITPPVFTQQPSSVTICEGSPASFSVIAAGATSYQWQQDIGGTWSNIPGATGTTYNISSTAGMNGRRFRCSITGTCTSIPPVNSYAASIVFSSVDQYDVSLPGIADICPGSSTSINLEGSNSGRTYKLYKDGLFDRSQPGTDGVLSWNPITQAGTYTITGTSDEGCEIPMIGSATITLLENSVAPTSISGVTPICPNNNITLSFEGGKLGSGDSWRWYVNDPNSTPVSSGNVYTVSPSETTTYYVKAVGGSCLPSIPVSKVINVITPPVINQQPSNVSICAGSPTSFSVVASGAISYQWQAQIDGSWQDILGATSSVYNISSTYGMNGRNFHCIVYGECNSITSSSAKITFTSLPIFTVSGGGAICPGSATSISLSKSTSGCTYNLYLDENLLTTQSKTGTGEPLTWENISAAGSYTVKAVTVTGCQFIMNQSAVITIKTPSTPPNSIIASNGTICLNDSSVLTINGGNLETGVANWKWTTGTGSCGSALLPYNQTSISIRPTESTTYFVHAEGGCVTTPCVSYTVTVLQPPIITGQPSDAVIQFSDNALFSVVASGSNLQYQWQSSPTNLEDWTNVPGQVTSVLSIPNSDVFDPKLYRCHISSPCGELNSDAVKITIPTEYYAGSQIKKPSTHYVNSFLPVGSLPGKVEVNDLGAAFYNVPIDVPPGTAGMQPQLSIVYNSYKVNGLLGVGWDLNGLSAIERVPQNIYNDGKVVGVRLDITDRFALDSNRLICTTGNYGADGSVYSTELETFVKITSHGTAGNGPSWFIVETKDGKTIEYGNTPDSKVEAYGTSTVHKWRINKIKDVNNNYIDFIYGENAGESVITKILYTGNSTSGMKPYNLIKFIYSTKSDKNTSYVGGTKIISSQILSEIQIYNEDNLVRKYQFNYLLNFYSLLNEIIEFGKNGDRFNSTVIGWGNYLYEPVGWGNNYHDTPTFSLGIGGDPEAKNLFISGDYNGDGRTDQMVIPLKAIYTTSDKWRIYIAVKNDSTFLKKAAEGFLDYSFKGFVISDVDGDGKDEILKHSLELADSTYKDFLRVYKYNGTSLVRGDQQYDFNFDYMPNHKVLSADFNGDGKDECIVLNEYKNIIVANGLSEYGNLPSFDNPNSVTLTDFDGDGKKDILVIKGSLSKIYQVNPVNMQWTVIYSNTFPTYTDRIFVGDFNGDKKTDILNWNQNWKLSFSTGTSFVNADSVPSLRNYDPEVSPDDNNYVIADINGDKKDDIAEAYLTTNGCSIDVYYSKGIGSFKKETNSFLGNNINQNYFQIVDLDGDGNKEVLNANYDRTGGGSVAYFFHRNESPYLLTQISNGFALNTRIEYQRINNDPVLYKNSTDLPFPLVSFKGPMYVVSSVIVPTADRSNYIVDVYQYENAIRHIQGKGFLGFMKFTTTNEARSYQTIKQFSYNNSFYYLFLADQISKSAKIVWHDTLRKSFDIDVDPTLINQSHYTNKAISYDNKRYFPHNETIGNLNVLDNKTTFTKLRYDSCGNLLNIRTTYEDHNTQESYDVIEVSNFAYEPYGNYGIKNKIVTKVDTLTYFSKNPFIRVTSYTYDALGHLLSDTTDVGKPKAVTKTYSDYNTYGLPRQITTASKGLESRTIIYEYDDKSRFIKKTTNPINHFSTREFDPAYGNVKNETGIDGKTTIYEYDNFGRLNKIISPLGYFQKITMDWYGGCYRVTKEIPDYSKQSTIYDIYNREVIHVSKGLTNDIYSEKEYNSDGSIKRISKPHYASLDSIKWVKYAYDQFGRVDSIIDGPAIKIFKYLPDGISETSLGEIANRNYTKFSKKDGAGNLIYVKETTGNLTSEINYSYHSSGQPDTITSNNGSINYQYDEYGRPKSVSSPNSGTTTFVYNAFGELESQTDAKGQKTSFRYDKLSRVTINKSPEDSIIYEYNISGNGIEQIHTITKSNNTSQTFSYDQYGRVTNSTEVIDNDSFSTSYGYDSFNNVNSITYPSGIVIDQFYSNGYLNEIKKGNVTIWKLESVTADGKPKDLTLGPASPGIKTYFTYDSAGYLKTKRTGMPQNEWQQTYSFDHFNGNLKNRKYKLSGSQSELSESFTYDNYDRLINYGLSGHDSVSYMPNGNILFKTDAGTYGYSGNNNAVTSLTNTPDTSRKFIEDISYTSFNKPFGIKHGTDTILTFTYGCQNQRIKTVFSKNGSTPITKYYSGLYEKSVSGSNSTEYSYISSPYGIIAVDIKKGQSDTLYYIETDHLGSFTALINSATGKFSERSSFDAWGRRRNPNTWTYESVSPNTLMERGFTGHEHLDEFGIINMNGRIYDPIVGRFLGVDPFIQSSDFSQSYNGYSYCLNNPMKFVDPSGYLAAVREIRPEYYEKFISQLLAGLDLDGLSDYYSYHQFSSIEAFLNFQEKQYSIGRQGGWFYKNENAAYNYMWLASKLNKVEYAGYIMKNGVFVLPIMGTDVYTNKKIANTERRSFLEYYKYYRENGKFYFEIPSEFGTFDRYEALALIHTHPTGLSKYKDNVVDTDDRAWSDWSHIPIFCISQENAFSGAYDYWETPPGINGVTQEKITNVNGSGFKLIPFLIEFNKNR